MEAILALAFGIWLISIGVLAALGRTPDTRDSRFTVGPMLDRKPRHNWLRDASLR